MAELLCEASLRDGSRCKGQLVFVGYNILYNRRGQSVINNSYKCLRCKAVNGASTEYHLCKRKGIISEVKVLNETVSLDCQNCPLKPLTRVLSPHGMELPIYAGCPFYVRLLQKSELELVKPRKIKTSFGGVFDASDEIRVKRY